MTLLGPYAGLSWHFTVECDSEPLAGQIGRVFASLAADVEPKGRYVVISPRDGKPGTIRLDDELLLEAATEYRLYAHLLWHLNHFTVKKTTDKVLLHASAAEVDGRAVVMCAPSESGKTTLVAGLVMAGMKYLTDEAVALDPETGWITPFPKALAVDEGSWEVLAALRPEVPTEAAHLVQRQWQVPPAIIRPDAVSDGGDPAVLVLPRYARGGKTRSEPISPGAALLATLQETFELPRRAERDIRALGALLQTTPCHLLMVADLDDAVRCTLTALAES